MPKKPGNAGHGLEEFDPETGQYVAAPSGAKNSNKQPKKFANLDLLAGEEEESFGDWMQRRNFWLNEEVRDPDWVVDNIEQFFDKEVIDYMERWDYHTSASLSISGKTTYDAHRNMTLTNAIAIQMYKPMTPVEPQEFDGLKAQIVQRGDLWPSDAKRVPQLYLERGFSGDPRVIEASYLREQPNDLILTQGAHGSCVYTAYDGRTAQSYARRSSVGSSRSNSGYVMKYILDQTKAKGINESEVRQLRMRFNNRIQEIQDRITKHALGLGIEQSKAEKLGRIFKSTLEYDETFPAVICGYDIVYDPYSQYGLLLRFRHVKTRKDWE